MIKNGAATDPSHLQGLMLHFIKASLSRFVGEDGANTELNISAVL
jgi:hypothetical protein